MDVMTHARERAVRLLNGIRKNGDVLRDFARDPAVRLAHIDVAEDAATYPAPDGKGRFAF